ncbi:unnamed protein product [Durusdinium trenchii]|uniref:SET domain-containing protein n=1 Tax=Durusdinium trenchii TaxID=1381693 RepID=A0ABP0I7P1_9DINO
MTFMTSTPLMASPPPRPAPRPPRLRSGGLLPSGRSGLRLRRSSSQVLLPLLTLQACRRSVPAPRRGLEALSLDTKPRAQAQEQQLAAFRAWLKEGNAAVQSRGVRLQRSPLGGLGLFAQKNFPQGAVILEVPFEKCLEVDAHHFDLDDATVLQPILARAAEEYDVDAFVEVEAQKAVLALCQRLLLERQQGASSKFAEYLAVIPDPSELHPLQLRWPKRLSEQSALLSRMHHTVLERDNACMEALQPFEQVWKRRCWALNAVWTRAVHLVGAEGEERLSLVPLMDFMNHWTPTRSTSETWSCFYEIASDHLAVRAERAISKGEELTLLYGEFSDAQLLCNYGICPEMPCRNAFDEAAVSIGPYVLSSPAGEEAAAPDGALVAARAACLARHGWALQQKLVFRVPQELRPSGGDRVGPAHEEGRGLLALARLLSLETAEEVAQLEDEIFWMDLPGAVHPNTEIPERNLRGACPNRGG